MRVAQSRSMDILKKRSEMQAQVCAPGPSRVWRTVWLPWQMRKLQMRHRIGLGYHSAVRGGVAAEVMWGGAGRFTR